MVIYIFKKYTFGDLIKNLDLGNNGYLDAIKGKGLMRETLHSD